MHSVERYSGRYEETLRTLCDVGRCAASFVEFDPQSMDPEAKANIQQLAQKARDSLDLIIAATSADNVLELRPLAEDVIDESLSLPLVGF